MNRTEDDDLEEKRIYAWAVYGKAVWRWQHVLNFETRTTENNPIPAALDRLVELGEMPEYRADRLAKERP